jgi:hypothetical protein
MAHDVQQQMRDEQYEQKRSTCTVNNFDTTWTLQIIPYTAAFDVTTLFARHVMSATTCITRHEPAEKQKGRLLSTRLK